MFFVFYKFFFLLRIIFMKYLFLNVMSSFWKIYVSNYSSYNNFLRICFNYLVYLLSNFT